MSKTKIKGLANKVSPIIKKVFRIIWLSIVVAWATNGFGFWLVPYLPINWVVMLLIGIIILGSIIIEYTPKNKKDDTNGI